MRTIAELIVDLNYNFKISPILSASMFRKREQESIFFSFVNKLEEECDVVFHHPTDLDRLLKYVSMANCVNEALSEAFRLEDFDLVGELLQTKKEVFIELKVQPLKSDQLFYYLDQKTVGLHPLYFLPFDYSFKL